jgi:hypothetical protein
MADNNPQNMNSRDWTDRTHADERIDPAPTERERADREADKPVHKGAESEQEFDKMQMPFTK